MFKALRSHKFYVPLVTIAVSVGLFLMYYFFYVARQRSYANERAFRLLTVLDEQLVNRRDNLKNVFSAALADTNPEEYLNKYLKGIVVDRISNPRNTCPKVAERDEDKVAAREGEFTLSHDSAHARGFLLSAMFKPVKENCYLSATLDLGEVTRGRFHDVTQDYFDDILIATSSGEVLFQKNLAGVSITNLGGLLSAKEPAGNEKKETKKTTTNAAESATEIQLASEFTNTRDVEIAGARYTLYIQPSSVDIASLESSAKGKLLVCGLWRADRLQSEVVAIPYPVLIWGSLLLLTVSALLWPLLKVAYMSPAERLKRRHVFYLLTSTLIVATLLTVIVLNASYSLRAEEEAREQLAYLANQIDRNIQSELKRSLDFMNTLAADPPTQEILRAGKDHKWENFPLGKYPYFDHVFWLDEAGKQRYKVTIKPHTTPSLDQADKPYFEDILEERHLIREDAIPCYGCHKAPAPPPGTDARFRFDSLYSRNTGEFLVVIAKPYKLPGPESLSPLRAQVMTAKFLSLVDPVMPPGFGFALVNHEGTAMIHSISARSGIENFFKECHQDPALQALVVQGASDYLKLDYMGKRQHMFVEPLPYLAEPALTLVVFRDPDYYSTINVASLLVFAMLVGLFSIPFMTGLAICMFRPRDYPLEQLWPSEGEMSRYFDIVVACLGMALAFVLHFSKMKMNETLLDILLMTGVAASLCLVRGGPSSSWMKLTKILVLVAIVAIAGRSAALVAALIYVVLLVPEVSFPLRQKFDRWVPLKFAYLGMVLSLLVVVVVLPCFGLFRISYNTVNRLALQNSQLMRRDQLTHRADEVREYARKIGLKPEDARFVSETRIAEKLDRYDRAVFFPKDENETISSKCAAPDVSWLEPRIAWASGSFAKSRLGAELRVTALARYSDDTDWRSEQDGDDELLWLINNSESSTNPENAKEDLLGVYPLWQMTPQTELMLAPLGMLLALWLWYLIRKVFLVDVVDLPQPNPWSPAEAGSRNLLIIGDSGDGKDALLLASPDADALDLQEVASAGWTLPALPAPTTRVAHFEFDLHNPDTCSRKLDLLEQLQKQNKRVVLLSAVDPMFFLSGSDAGQATSNGAGSTPVTQFLERWTSVFHGFEKVRMPDVSAEWFEQVLAHQKKNGAAQLIDMIESECRYTPELRRLGLGLLLSHGNDRPMSKGQFLEVMLERAEAYYNRLWFECTPGERLVLYQLALDGWANPKNEQALRQLQQRDIVRRGSGFRLMNDSLGRYVRNRDPSDDVARWEVEEEHSAWSAMKLALGTALMMCGAWLLYAQQDIFQLGIGYLTALGSASGALISLTRTLRGKGAPTPG